MKQYFHNDPFEPGKSKLQVKKQLFIHCNTGIIASFLLYSGTENAYTIK